VSQRLARLDVVAIIRELRREQEIDRDSDDFGAASPLVLASSPAVLTRLACVTLTPRLVTGRSTTDVLAAAAAARWPCTSVFFDGRGPTDCRLVGAAMRLMLLTRRSGSFSGFVETAAALCSYNDLLGVTPVELLIVVFAVSGS